MSDIETASAVEKLQLELQEGEKPAMVHLFSLVENTHANCLRASEEKRARTKWNCLLSPLSDGNEKDRFRGRVEGQRTTHFLLRLFPRRLFLQARRQLAPNTSSLEALSVGRAPPPPPPRPLALGGRGKGEGRAFKSLV